KMDGIWAWTDVRGIWYWKDLLNQANLDPNMLKTWNGYITAAKKLNTVLRPQGIEGVHLTGASHSPDVWYPYLWMLGGDIIKQELDNIGFIPMFPVPDNKTKSSTLMGGWEFGIPVTSSHKNIAWEIIELMLEPEILSPWLAKQGFLPTQITLGQDTNPYADHL